MTIPEQPPVTFDPPLPPGYGDPPVGMLPPEMVPPDDIPADPPPAAAAVDDSGPILPGRRTLTLVSGTRVRLRPLKTRELLGALRIAVGGLGGRIEALRLNPEESMETFVARFATLLLSAMPYAEDETMAFLRMVCEPDGYVEVGALERGAKAIRERNKVLEALLDVELKNPEPDDTITIIEGLALDNAGDLQSWGKRIAGIVDLALRTGLIPASPTSTA